MIITPEPIVRVRWLMSSVLTLSKFPLAFGCSASWFYYWSNSNYKPFNSNHTSHLKFFFSFFFFICSGFCLTLKWNSHRFTCVPHPNPPSHLPLHPIPLGFPSAPGPSACLVSCIQPELVICFTLDNKHVSMLFSWNIPPSPSPTESKRLFYKYVSFFFSVLHIGLSLTSL